MAAMGLCVIALLVVVNLLEGARTDREITRALQEMVATVESVRAYQQEAAAAEPEWRVESFVEQETPSPAPSPTPSPEETPAPSPEEETAWEDLQDYGDRDDWFGRPPKGPGKKPEPWWFNFQYAETTPEPSAEPSLEPEETVVNHYYYYYPQDTSQAENLRNSAMNQYSGRLCVVCYPAEGEVTVGMSDGNALTEPEAIALADQMRQEGRASGDLDAYRYQVKTGEGATWVYFLDCTTEKAAMRSLLLLSVLVGLGGLVVTGVLVYFLSRKAMEPLKESMELQKRFITDAGHELKTPLAVIGTNMDILEMDLGKNEWVSGTKKQLVRLRKLVANLISLSRMEEMQEALELSPVNLSETALECVDAFQGPAELAGKALEAEIQPDLWVQGDVSSLGQLLTILCDNAVKYAAGDIRVRLYQSGRKVLFETENDWDRAIPPEELDRLFDRFYRGDASRTTAEGKSGYGLGLSIARAVAGKNKGTLTAEETPEGRLLFRVTMKKG